MFLFVQLFKKHRPLGCGIKTKNRIINAYTACKLPFIARSFVTVPEIGLNLLRGFSTGKRAVTNSSPVKRNGAFKSSIVAPSAVTREMRRAKYARGASKIVNTWKYNMLKWRQADSFTNHRAKNKVPFKVWEHLDKKHDLALIENLTSAMLIDSYITEFVESTYYETPVFEKKWRVFHQSKRKGNKLRRGIVRVLKPHGRGRDEKRNVAYKTTWYSMGLVQYAWRMLVAMHKARFKKERPLNSAIKPRQFKRADAIKIFLNTVKGIRNPTARRGLFQIAMALENHPTRTPSSKPHRFYGRAFPTFAPFSREGLFDESDDGAVFQRSEDFYYARVTAKFLNEMKTDPDFRLKHKKAYARAVARNLYRSGFRKEIAASAADEKFGEVRDFVKGTFGGRERDIIAGLEKHFIKPIVSELTYVREVDLSGIATRRERLFLPIVRGHDLKKQVLDREAMPLVPPVEAPFAMVFEAKKEEFFRLIKYFVRRRSLGGPLAARYKWGNQAMQYNFIVRAYLEPMSRGVPFWQLPIVKEEMAEEDRVAEQINKSRELNKASMTAPLKGEKKLKEVSGERRESSEGSYDSDFNDDRPVKNSSGAPDRWHVFEGCDDSNKIGRVLKLLTKRHDHFINKDRSITVPEGTVHFAPNDVRNPNCRERWFESGLNPSYMASFDREYVNEFIFKKKVLNKIIIPDRSRSKTAIYDRIPYKYFFLNYKVDPVYNSFLLDKIVNTFTKHGDRKKKVRKLFYEIMYENNYTPDIFYYIVESLRPKYINVVARRGREVYRAPITASRTKSIMKAIRFFKKAVMARKHEKTFKLKIVGEIDDYLGWEGYRNKFFDDYVQLSEDSMHLQHFRSKRIY